MLITLQEHKVRQHLVPHSCSVWSYEETTVTEHTFHWCWGSRCAEDPLEEAVRLMLHSFPEVWVSRETAGLLTNKSEVVPHDCWYRNMAFSRLFTLLGSKPKTRAGNKFPKAKAKDLASEAKAKDTVGCPQGQGHVLEDSNSATNSGYLISFRCWLSGVKIAEEIVLKFWLLPLRWCRWWWLEGVLTLLTSSASGRPLQ